MPIAVRIVPHKMSKAEYEEVIQELQKQGNGDPDGRVLHTSYGDDDEVHMFEVWESREQFDAHHEKLMDVLDGAGVDAGLVEVSQLQGHVG
jgi:quinol monooxygenase YgiN